MAILELKREKAARDLTSQVTVLTHVMAESHIVMGLVQLGDGVANLDGTGGSFELTIVCDGQTGQADPAVVVFSTAVRSAVWTGAFPAPKGATVLLKVKSPNAADTAVNVTAILYAVGLAVDADARADVGAIQGINALGLVG